MRVPGPSVIALAAMAMLGHDAVAQAPIERRFAARADGLVRISNLAGSIKVTGWDRDSVVITGTISESGGASFFLGYGAEGAKLGVWTDEPGPALRPSSLDVRVPRNSRLRIEAGSSTIAVFGIEGSLDLHSASGLIQVGGNPEEIVAESLAGEIDIDAVARSARAKTASGNIRVRGGVRVAVVNTVSGNITAEGDRFDRGTFETVDGDIHYFGNVGAAALDFVSHSGAVELSLPPAASADFLISTFSGAFEDQFGVKAEYSGNKLKGQEIRFSTGSGGAPVTVRNFKGRVVLRRRG